MSNVLVIVDVQKQFKEYMQHDLVKELGNYANTFDAVYQIWDTHDNAVQPSYKFPKQVDCVPKLFGKNFFSDKVTKYIKSIEDSTDNGKVFKLSDGEGYVIRVTNNHDWFHINPEIVDMIGKIKNDTVTVVGGAGGECIQDIFQALLSFGVNVSMNNKYVYDAKTSQQDSVKENKIMSFNEFIQSKKINENKVIKPTFFEYTHYRFPTNEELTEIDKCNLTNDELLHGFTYNIVGKGIKSEQKKQDIKKCIEMLCELSPKNKQYKELLKSCL